MKTVVTALVLAFTASLAIAQAPHAAPAADKAAAPAANASCEDQATAKKLAGAAKGSFMKKCERDANAAKAVAACGEKAAEKKLAGAAKNSFMKKCEKDAQAAKQGSPAPPAGRRRFFPGRPSPWRSRCTPRPQRDAGPANPVAS